MKIATKEDIIRAPQVRVMGGGKGDIYQAILLNDGSVEMRLNQGDNNKAGLFKMEQMIGPKEVFWKNAQVIFTAMNS